MPAPRSRGSPSPMWRRARPPARMNPDVAVVIEHLQGAVAEVSFEMLAKGRGLASSLGGRLVAVLAGQSVERVVGELGAADEVALIEHEVLAQYNPVAAERAVAEALRALAPRLTLVASSAMGLDLAGGLAVSLGWP